MQACKCLQMPRLTRGETRSPCTINKHNKNYLLTKLYHHNYHLLDKYCPISTQLTPEVHNPPGNPCPKILLILTTIKALCSPSPELGPVPPRKFLPTLHPCYNSLHTQISENLRKKRLNPKPNRKSLTIDPQLEATKPRLIPK